MLKITVLTEELKKNCREFYEYTWAVLSKNHFNYYLHDNNLKQDDTNNLIYYTEGNYTFVVSLCEESSFTYSLNNTIDVYEGREYKGSYNLSGNVFIEKRYPKFDVNNI